MQPRKSEKVVKVLGIVYFHHLVSKQFKCDHQLQVKAMEDKGKDPHFLRSRVQPATLCKNMKSCSRGPCLLLLVVGIGWEAESSEAM